MKTLYIVIEHGGEYEDSWENPIAVCETKEIAEKIAFESESKHSNKSSVTYDEYLDAEDKYYDEYPDDMFVDYKKLSELLPEHSEKEWEQAYTFYESAGDDYDGAYIKEIIYYTE